MKRDRLTQDSIGRLSLLLVHAMSHVAVAEFETDSSTAFLQEFYQSLSILNDDLFFARYKAKSDDGEKLFNRDQMFLASHDLNSNHILLCMTETY